MKGLKRLKSLRDTKIAAAGEDYRAVDEATGGLFEGLLGGGG